MNHETTVVDIFQACTSTIAGVGLPAIIIQPVPLDHMSLRLVCSYCAGIARGIFVCAPLRQQPTIALNSWISPADLQSLTRQSTSGSRRKRRSKAHAHLFAKIAFEFSNTQCDSPWLHCTSRCLCVCAFDGEGLLYLCPVNKQTNGRSPFSVHWAHNCSIVSTHKNGVKNNSVVSIFLFKDHLHSIQYFHWLLDFFRICIYHILK